MTLISCPGRITYKTEKLSNQHFGKLKPMLKLQEPIIQVKIKIIFIGNKFMVRKVTTVRMMGIPIYSLKIFHFFLGGEGGSSNPKSHLVERPKSKIIFPY